MLHSHQKALAAAKELSKSLALPSSRASIFAWCDDGSYRLVVSGDKCWLAYFANVPSEFEGFPVIIEDSLDAAVRHTIH